MFIFEHGLFKSEENLTLTKPHTKKGDEMYQN